MPEEIQTQVQQPTEGQQVDNSQVNQQSTVGQQENQSVKPKTDQTPERTYTRSEISDMMRKRVERSHKSFYDRYGVKDLNELDDLFGKAKGYDELSKSNTDLKSQLEEALHQNQELNKKLLYVQSNINPEKYGDIEAYFKGKGMEINAENLANELKTHSNWQINKVVTLNNEQHDTHVDNEKEIASRFFGVKL